MSRARSGVVRWCDLTSEQRGDGEDSGEDASPPAARVVLMDSMGGCIPISDIVMHMKGRVMGLDL